MLQTTGIILVVSVILLPIVSTGQGGIGGTVVHRPNPGCACLPSSDGEIQATGTKAVKNRPESSPKLSEKECQKKGDVTTIYTGAQVDRRAVILDKPEPEVPEDATVDRAPGRVILKAVFCPNGTVGRVGLVLAPSKEMNESVMKAAKKIRFEPAIKSGKPVAQYVQLEYNIR